MVEADEELVGIEKQIMVGLLQGLRDGVQLALVRARVVRLALAGHRTYEVRVYAHGKADDVDGFLDVRFPVASLLGIIDAFDEDIVVLISIGIDTERREPCFAGILGAGKEVDYALLFLFDALHPLDRVGYTFGTEDTLPVAFVDLYLVLDRGCVLKLGFLGGGNELLDIIPARFEDSSVIRYRIVRITCGGYACDDGKLALLGAVLEAGLQIRPRIIEIEQRNVLHITGRNEVLERMIKVTQKPKCLKSRQAPRK